MLHFDCYIIQIDSTRRVLLKTLFMGTCSRLQVSRTGFRISQDGMGYDSYSEYGHDWEPCIRIPLTEPILPHIPKLKELFRKHVDY